MIQGLVLLFIGADVLILYLWKRKGLPRPRLPPARRHRVPTRVRRRPGRGGAPRAAAAAAPRC